MNTCPCCSHRLLRHIRSHEVYFFCRQCWQEMPLLNQKTNHQFQPVLSHKPKTAYINTI